MALERQASFQHIVYRCICTLLDAVPHFNFRESLLAAVIKNIGSSDDVVRFWYIYILCSLYLTTFYWNGSFSSIITCIICNALISVLKFYLSKTKKKKSVLKWNYFCRMSCIKIVAQVISYFCCLVGLIIFSINLLIHIHSWVEVKLAYAFCMAC